MSTRLVAGGGAVIVLLAVAGPAVAKRGDRVPAWVGPRTAQAVTRLFGGAPPLAATFNFPERHRVVVVLEFRNVVTCRTCRAEASGVRPHGRVVRLAFDRATRRLTGGLRFCEVHGVTPPLSACLRR
jgi:hypothetical protein